MSKRKPSPWYIAIDVLEPGAPPYGLALGGEDGSPEKSLFAAAGPELLPEVLAHEIAHAKVHPLSRTYRAKGGEPVKKAFIEHVLREARALTYACIKGWPGPGDAKQVTERVDEPYVRKAALQLLRKELITEEEYREFIEELD